jgi:LysM repeat protein
MKSMTSTRYLALAAIALSLPSCGMFKKGGDENYDTAGDTGNYDTSNPYGVPDGGAGESVPYQAVNPPADNPTYGQAAYEESAPGPASAAPTHGAPAAAASTSHTVARGDTLSGIARQYGTTASAIKQANGMSSDTVVLGKTLVIPGSSGPVSRPAAAAGGKTYTVVKGDTLSSIARRNGTTVSAIKQANGMSSDTVILGSKLRIP